MSELLRRMNLQLFGEGGDGAAAAGEGNASAVAGDMAAPDAGEARLRALGVPEDKLAKHRESRMRARQAQAQPAKTAKPQVSAAEQKPTPNEEAGQEDASQAASEAHDAPEVQEAQPAATEAKRLSWDEIMADPEYNREMQGVVQARLKSAKEAEATLQKLMPALTLLAEHHGLDPKSLDAEALAKAISDDDSYYEDKAMELGVTVEAAKKLEQDRQATERKKAEEEAQAEAKRRQEFDAHFASLRQQGEAMKKTFPQFDLMTEMKNPSFARMTSPGGGISVEDAYYAIHRREIQTAAMEAAARKAAEQMTASIRAGQSRPTENGAAQQTAKPTLHMESREEREALKRRIRAAAARGEKIYPGQ